MTDGERLADIQQRVRHDATDHADLLWCLAKLTQARKQLAATQVCLGAVVSMNSMAIPAETCAACGRTRNPGPAGPCTLCGVG